MVRCSWKKSCGIKYHIWEGTIFYKSKLNKLKLLKIIQLWLQKLNNKTIAWFFDLSRNSVNKILTKLSKVLVPNYYKNLEQIGGNGTIVEIDESKFRKRKYYRKHAVDGVWVLGMVERTEKRRIILLAIDDRAKSTLAEKITSKIEKQSILYTDCWKGYSGIDRMGFTHQKENHGLHFVDNETGTHTNTIEGNWWAFKM